LPLRENELIAREIQEIREPWKHSKRQFRPAK
jgi:hypothetical protein